MHQGDLYKSAVSRPMHVHQHARPVPLRNLISAFRLDGGSTNYTYDQGLTVKSYEHRAQSAQM